MNLSISFPRHALVIQTLAQAGKFAVDGQVRAINRTLSRGRAQGVQRIGKKVQLKAAYIRENLAIARTATRDNLKGTIRARARETRLDRFPNKQIWGKSKRGKRIKAGVNVRIKRDRGNKLIKSAFMVPLRSGKTDGANGYGIAVRVDVLRKLGYTVHSGSLGGHGSRAYEVLHASSVRDLFEDVIGEGLGDDLQAYYLQQIDSEMRRAIQRARA